MEYRINLDNTITPVKMVESEFRKKLRKKHKTPNADKILREKPEMKNFDSYKFFK